MRHLLGPILLAFSVLPAFSQTPVIAAVDNGFSFTNKLSPGVLASVFGSNLDGNNLQVIIKGKQCPVTFHSAAQLNIQVPWEVTTGGANAVVKHDGLSSAPFAVTISPYSPAFATQPGSTNGIFFSGPNLITDTHPANAGDILVSYYAVGLGATTPAIATGQVTPDPPPLYVTLVTPGIVVGGKSASIQFSGLAPEVLATDQLNFTLAPDTPVGTDTIVLSAGSANNSQTTIPIACLDVTNAVSVSLGPLNHPSAGKYTQKVTIQNVSGKRIQPQGSLILTSLTSSAQLTNGGGAACPSSDSAPYKSFTFTGSGASQTATVTLAFTDTTTGSITYGQRILAK